MPSQFESEVGRPGTQTFGRPPPETLVSQLSTVRRQAPVPQDIVPSPSSVDPSQSLSTPSHGAVVAVPGMQLAGVSTPLVQLDVDDEAQAPTPQFAVVAT